MRKYRSGWSAMWVCSFALFAQPASAETIRCQVSYTILNGFVVRQKVKIDLPKDERDLALWLVERKSGVFKKLAYPIGGEGSLEITRPFSDKKTAKFPFIVSWRPLSGDKLTGFFHARRHVHSIVVRREKGRRVIEIFPAFPGHIGTKLARGTCE